MKIDHVGVVVRSIEKGIALWRDSFGYEQQTEIVTNTRQKVNVVFLGKEDSVTIKLVQPTDASSPAFAALKKGGGGLHHLCFKCDSLENELPRLTDLGMRLLVEPQPGEAFDNEKIAFVYASQGLNIEVIDTDKRAKKIKETQ